MLTALEVEYAAVRAHLSGIAPHHHPSGTLFEVGTACGQEIALALTGMGNSGAATMTERAITEFAPDVVMFVGVAGGLRDWLELGEVVVASRVYGYHGGRETEHGFLARPRAWDIPHHVEQIARALARGGDWCPDPPEVHFEPIAAGEVVLNSTRSPLAKQIHRNYNDAVAVEMESAGVANAAHLHMATPSVTVRGISDLVDDKDLTDRQGWQPRAAANAAAFAVALAGALTHPRRSQRKAPPVGDSFTFHNNGATIGTQIGKNEGTVHSVQHTAPRDRLDAITAAVVHAHDTGQIDTDLFTTAMVALDNTRNSSGPPDLRRLKALLGGVPALRPALDSIVDD
ncbi:5'-methylthioadenosine/S-adenosylhomocysteine nucleosidase [Nocardia sp. NRRL S-836]|uniref:5'-methylthioadenosine/S-adenosylhomocysteine nucleosidase family protein n=1 Tax=Nocardia sp. NRRL S-836 TaxID=1519492 RepID=UPI0018D191B2|nr:5'-methylthioadenosine/S-adenosylhomocysteine nucleosidase [Nocardia sp. NRRL S-836]